MGWKSLWAGLWRNLKSRKVEIKQRCWDTGRKIFVHSLHQGLCQPWVFICQPGAVSSVQAKEWGAPFIHGGQQTPKREGEPGGYTHGSLPWKKEGFRVSVREKSEHYEKWSEWDIRYWGGGNGGDTVAHGLQMWGVKLWLIQNTKRKQIKRITENVGTVKNKQTNKKNQC